MLLSLYIGAWHGWCDGILHVSLTSLQHIWLIIFNFLQQRVSKCETNRVMILLSISKIFICDEIISVWTQLRVILWILFDLNHLCHHIFNLISIISWLDGSSSGFKLHHFKAFQLWGIPHIVMAEILWILWTQMRSKSGLLLCEWRSAWMSHFLSESLISIQSPVIVRVHVDSECTEHLLNLFCEFVSIDAVFYSLKILQ